MRSGGNELTFGPGSPLAPDVPGAPGAPWEGRRSHDDHMMQAPGMWDLPLGQLDPSNRPILDLRLLPLGLVGLSPRLDQFDPALL